MVVAVPTIPTIEIMRVLKERPAPLILPSSNRVTSILLVQNGSYTEETSVLIGRVWTECENCPKEVTFDVCVCAQQPQPNLGKYVPRKSLDHFLDVFSFPSSLFHPSHYEQ